MKPLCLLAILLGLCLTTAAAAPREWTSSDGKTITGTPQKLDGDTLTLETDRGTFEVPLSRFSEADQTFAREWAKESAAMDSKKGEAISGEGTAQFLGDFENLTLGEWPQYVTADLELDQIEEVPSEDGITFIYRTPHFEFRAPDNLSTSVVREFARIFEASYAFVDQMPIGLAPKPSANGYYVTELYMTREDYFADGGMTGSGGMFTWRRRGNEMSGEIKVPLPNLGVEYTGTRFIVDHKRRSTTLTHEITHQIMIRWLATPMPTWLSEGIAEVVSSQDYDNGRFKLNSMDRAIAEEVTRGQGRDFRMVGLERLMNISHSEWASELASGSGGRNYNSSSVLAYYFLKLDGEGDGKHLVEYLKVLATGDKEAAEEARDMHLLRDRSYTLLEEEVAAAWRSEGLKIEFSP